MTEPETTPLHDRHPELFPPGWVDQGPAREVSTTETIAVRVSTNQYGVKTFWIAGPDGKFCGCTPCAPEHEAAYELLERFLSSWARAPLPAGLESAT